MNSISFNINDAIAILERTPKVIETLLEGLSNEWIENNEGDESWSPYDVAGHLINGEKTDWIPRMQIILDDTADKHFLPFNRFAQFEASNGKTIQQLIEEFKTIRRKNIEILKAATINETTLRKTGIHPEFGEVTLRQLLATWVAHDLSHLSQITRVMAKQYKTEVGPWTKYLSLLSYTPS